MSKRSSIVNSLVDKLKLINGQDPYQVNLFNNAYNKLKFWDEVQDFPSVYVHPGNETREYLPSNFRWGYLGICIKVYCHGEDSQEQLEKLLGDIETCISLNENLDYNTGDTTEILIQSIVTDEGLLQPYAIGEINLQVRYALTS